MYVNVEQNTCEGNERNPVYNVILVFNKGKASKQKI